MSGRLPPKAPQPIVGTVSHFTIELKWGEFIDRLKEIFTKDDGKIQVELQQKYANKDTWTLLYSGYDMKIAATNLESDTAYNFRMRFKNKHGWGEWSPPVNVSTTKQPLTGEDIHKAIRMNDEVELLRVLEKGEASIEAQDKLGFTPLMATCQRGLRNLASILIEWKADLETKNDSGKTALMLASFKGMNECIDLLIDNGAKLDSRDLSGLTALHYAVDGEHPQSIRLLIKRSAPLDIQDYEMGWTPLIRCAGLKNNGNVQVARELLFHGASVDIVDKGGKTALHNAIINGHQNLVELLLTEGADIFLKTQKGYDALSLTESMDNRYVKAVMTEHCQKAEIPLHPGTLRVVKS